MGTTPNKRPQNNVTISRGGNVPARRVNPESGNVDRSFAQPNPAVEHEEPTPKSHASKKDEKEALNKNSKLGKKYDEEDSDNKEE